MASRIKLIDVTKLTKNSSLVIQQSSTVMNKAKVSLNKQQQFMDEVGMDRQTLRNFINGDKWSAQQKHKARQELLRWNEELKAEVAHDVSAKRKEIRLAARLLRVKTQTTQKARRRRTGFL